MFCVIVMECRFSAQWLSALIAAGTLPDVVLVAHPFPVVFRPSPAPIHIGAPNLRVDEIAARHGIQLYRVHQWDAVPDTFLARLQHIIVACYPRLLPAARFAAHGITAWNIHPSPLPLLRGPDPLFYTARGDAPPAVSIHTLSEVFDAGDVLAQIHLPETDVADERAYIDVHARQAAAMVATLRRDVLPRGVPQQHTAASWAPAPSAADYTLQPSWSCARVTRFMTCTSHRQMPYLVAASGQRVRQLHHAGSVEIPCADGFLSASAWD